MDLAKQLHVSSNPACEANFKIGCTVATLNVGRPYIQSFLQWKTCTYDTTKTMIVQGLSLPRRMADAFPPPKANVKNGINIAIPNHLGSSIRDVSSRQRRIPHNNQAKACKENTHARNHSLNHFDSDATRRIASLATQSPLGLWTDRWAWLDRRHPADTCLDGTNLIVYHFKLSTVKPCCTLRTPSVDSAI